MNASFLQNVIVAIFNTFQGLLFRQQAVIEQGQEAIEVLTLEVRRLNSRVEAHEETIKCIHQQNDELIRELVNLKAQIASGNIQVDQSMDWSS